MSKIKNKGYEVSIFEDRFIQLSTNPKMVNLMENQYLK